MGNEFHRRGSTFSVRRARSKQSHGSDKERSRVRIPEELHESPKSHRRRHHSRHHAGQCDGGVIAGEVSWDDRAGGVNTMNRSELVRWLVLNEISDDYENVDQIILANVAKQGAKLRLAIDRSEIVDALAHLIEEGLAKAYLLCAKEPCSTEVPGMPALDVIEE